MSKSLLFLPIIALVGLVGCGTPFDRSDSNPYLRSMSNLESEYQAGEFSEAEYLQRRQEIVSIAIAQEQMQATKKQAMFNAMMQNRPSPVNQNAGLENAIKMRSLMTGNRRKIYDSNGQYLGYAQEE